MKREDFGAMVNVKGWVRTRRGSKQVNFIALNDGSTINNVQVVVDLANFEMCIRDRNGAVLRHLDLPASNSMMVVHPQKTIIAESDGRRVLRTHYFFEIEQNGQKRGWWKKHPYNGCLLYTSRCV